MPLEGKLPRLVALVHMAERGLSVLVLVELMAKTPVLLMAETAVLMEVARVVDQTAVLAEKVALESFGLVVLELSHQHVLELHR